MRPAYRGCEIHCVRKRGKVSENKTSCFKQYEAGCLFNYISDQSTHDDNDIGVLAILQKREQRRRKLLAVYRDTADATLYSIWVLHGDMIDTAAVTARCLIFLQPGGNAGADA